MSLQTTDLARKRPQRGRELVPGAQRIGLLAEELRDPTLGTTGLLVSETRAAAAALGLTTLMRQIGRGDDLETAIVGFKCQRVEASRSRSAR